MATQETTPGSQTEESNALDLPSAYDMRDYVLQRPSQETNSEAFSSEEACSIPCSSDVDPGLDDGPSRLPSPWAQSRAYVGASGSLASVATALAQICIFKEHSDTKKMLAIKMMSSSSDNIISVANNSNLNTEQNDSWTSENSWLYHSVKGQPETKEEDDGLRKSLDKFYEVFGNPQPASGNSLSTSVCQCLSQKINELKDQENQKYTLRSFQIARVIFNQNGCSILQKHSRDAHFYPLREESTSLQDEKLMPGLSKDIIHFLLQQNLMKDQ